MPAKTYKKYPHPSYVKNNDAMFSGHGVIAAAVGVELCKSKIISTRNH